MRLADAPRRAYRWMRCWQAVARRYAPAACVAERHLYAGTLTGDDERVLHRYATALERARTARERAAQLDAEQAAIRLMYRSTDDDDMDGDE